MNDLLAGLLALAALGLPSATHCSAAPTADPAADDVPTVASPTDAEPAPADDVVDEPPAVAEPADEVATPDAGVAADPAPAAVAAEPARDEGASDDPSPAPDPDDALPADVAAVLERAARFQRGETPLGPPTGLHGRFSVHVVDRRDNSQIDARVERTYTRDPERMVTTRQDNLVDSDSTVGFDGDRTWFRDNATGQVIVYSDDPLTFEVDLEQLEEQLRLMPVLLDAFVLDALVPRLRGARLEGGPVALPLPPHGDETRTVQWVVGRMDDELFPPEPGPPPMPGETRAPDEVQVGLAVATDVDADEDGARLNGALLAFRVRTLGRSDAREILLRFDHLYPTQTGLVVPAFTQVHEDGDSLPSITLSIIPDTEVGGLFLDLDPEVDPSIFAVPR